MFNNIELGYGVPNQTFRYSCVTRSVLISQIADLRVISAQGNTTPS